MIRNLWSVGLMWAAVGAAQAAERAPAFADFPSSAATIAKPAEPHICCHPDAERYRTMLRSGARKGPNFAGHYTIVTWGCGSSCRRFAIVDAQSGKVHFPEALRYDAYAEMPLDTQPFSFRRDSRLLIVDGSPNGDEKTGRFYFAWEEEQLRPVAEEIK